MQCIVYLESALAPKCGQKFDEAAMYGCFVLWLLIQIYFLASGLYHEFHKDNSKTERQAEHARQHNARLYHQKTGHLGSAKRLLGSSKRLL